MLPIMTSDSGYGNRDDAARGVAGKTFSSGSRSASAIPSGSGRSSGSLHRFMMRSLPTFDVRQDERVLEVDEAVLPVLHRSFVEDLEEDLVNVGVGLLDLVEEARRCTGGAAPPR